MRDQNLLDLQQRLLMLESSKPVSTSSELAAVRCPLCGDSTNIRSAHMYIGIKDINGKEIVVYDCKKCGQSGTVTPNLLHRLGIVDIQIDEYLKSTYDTKYIKNFENEKDTSKIIYKYPHPTKQDESKIQYMSNRLQLDFSDYENIKKYKVVYDFGKFLAMNNIQHPQCNREKIELLSQEGIGFVGEDKTNISIRNFNPELTGSRFNIIHLFEGKRRPYLYMPPCKVDVLTPTPRIVLSESSFNIICVKNYFFSDDSTDAIFGSSSRKGCAHAAIRLMQLSGFVHGKLDIYADNDPDFSIDYFKNLLAPFSSTFDTSIILNMDPNLKDFGEMPKQGEAFNNTKVYRI